MVPSRRAKFVPLASAATARVFVLRSKVRSLKDQIPATADQAALEAIDLSAG